MVSGLLIKKIMASEENIRREALCTGCGACTLSCMATHPSPAEDFNASFFKVMEGNFSSSMEIPVEFIIRLKSTSFKDAILKGPSGYLWCVQFCCTNPSASFRDGWESFVYDNDIAAKDILVFRHIIDLYFIVRVFGATLCEKQGVALHQNYTSSCFNKGIMPKICNQKNFERRTKVTPLNSFVEPKKNEEIELKSLTADKEALDCRVAAVVSTKRRSILCKTQNDISQNQIILFKKRPRNLGAVANVAPCSITNDNYAFKSIDLMDPKFSVVLVKTAVDDGCRLTIPIKFADHWLPGDKAKIVLMHHVNPGIWKAVYRRYTRGSYLFWRSFVASNDLHEQDTCIFKLINIVHCIFKVYVNADTRI